MKQKFTLSATTAITLICNVGFAQLFPIPFEAKAENAMLIAEGRVVAQRGFWNDKHTMMYTANTVEVYKTFKGELGLSNTVDVVTVGGTVGNDYVETSHLLSLNEGEVGMFFLQKAPTQLKHPLSGKAMYDVFSSEQGFLKYNLSNATASAPFAAYSSIEGELYGKVKQTVQQSFKVIDASFRAVVVPRTIIKQDALVAGFSPASVVAGAHNSPAINTLTINGSGFGSADPGKFIVFRDGNSTTATTVFAVAHSSALINSWTDNQIVLKVPSRASTGRVGVVVAPGDTAFSAGNLQVPAGVLTASFTDGSVQESRLVNMNGQGGYTIVYCTNTAGDGIDITSDFAYEAFRRALETIKKIAGANIIEGGTTLTQTVSAGDGVNIIMYDNRNTGIALTSAGVLGTTYSSNSRCSGSPRSQKRGFDIVINNPGVSGSIGQPFNKNICQPQINTYDMEAMLLHELGHAINMAHMIDPQEQTSGFTNRNPAGLLHPTITLSISRRSLDFSSLFAGTYAVLPQNHLDYGSCTVGQGEMVPIAITPRPLDDCPSVFPTGPIANGTAVLFDLELATSNKFGDPQFTAIGTAGATNGTGVMVSNNLYYPIRTNQAGAISVAITNYTTEPGGVASCVDQGVRFAVYKVNSCPAGQNFPAPVFAGIFTGNGSFDIPSLEAATNYLLFWEGRFNTKAKFTATFTGSQALPVKLRSFYGVAGQATNVLYYQMDAQDRTARITIERSGDGSNFTAIGNVAAAGAGLQSFVDAQPGTGAQYYRLVMFAADGTLEYSKVVRLSRLPRGQVSIYPNPVSDLLFVNLSSLNKDKYAVSLIHASGVGWGRQGGTPAKSD
jgi:hypothetical protein